MSKPSPFTISHDDLSYRVELDAHYVSDENMQIIRKYITTLDDENAKLRELVRRLVYATHPADRATLVANAAELGVVE